MESKYKAVITNKRLYKEVDLSPDDQTIRVGTTKQCSARFSRDMFFEDFEILLENAQNKWTMSTSGNIYFSSDGLLKLSAIDLCHGDELTFKYSNSNQEIFKFCFMIDFDYKAKDYNRAIDISETFNLIIGGRDYCDIQISDDLFGDGHITVFCKSNNGQYAISDNNTKYGVFVNGQKISGSAQLSDHDFISVTGYSFYLKFGMLYTTSSDKVIINGLPSKVITESKSHLEFPKFNLSPRVKYTIPNFGVKVLPPGQKPEKPESNIVINMIPVLLMIALTVVLRGVMGGGGMFVIFSVCTMGVGALMSVVAFISQRKNERAANNKRVKNYNAYIQRKEREIAAVRDDELRARELIYLSTDRSLQEVENFGTRLFEKRVTDDDFLKAYIGKGDIAAGCLTEITEQEFITNDDDLAFIPEQIKQKHSMLQCAPVISDFSTSCGIVGNRDLLAHMLRNLTLDIAARHFYKDVRLFYIFDDSEIKRFKWVRWLPHIKNESLGLRNIICDEESRNVLLEYLYTELSLRETSTSENNDACFPHFIVFVYNANDLYTHPVSKYIEKSAAYGFAFIFFEEYEECLPKGCTEIIRLDEQNPGELIRCENGEDKLTFAVEYADSRRAEKAALKLGAIYIDDITLEGELTRNISLYQLLNIFSCEDLDLTQRWAKSKVWKSMAAPLGVKRKNEIVSLNISDKTDGHGPHGLVAGTTGSGKSEILQSYVLSMATLYHPYDVGFVLIDFKGGGMANQFRDLPHLIGAMTNIDGREINRSLLSIKAELIRRQELFSKYGVNHIDNYIKLYREGKTPTPMPHLIMIVDEFAELKTEHPDFMKEIISAARIGRTLGVHLILATQKPAGIVDGQIWSNSKFKLCLKVQTKEDSNDVIKSPLASEIVEPGRTYFQVGNNEIFELFQSAYSGAKVFDGSDTDKKEYEINELNIWGKKSILYSSKLNQSEVKAKTQLDAIVEHIANYCRKSGITGLPGVCLPPLSESISLIDLNKTCCSSQDGIVIPIGVYDDPEQQKQATLEIDVSADNIQIIGASQMGKTTLLQTIICSLLKNYTPKDINIYVFDGGNMAMRAFEGANHIGGVALPCEEEKVRNLFKLLHKAVTERKEKFARAGVGTYKAYLEAGLNDLPLILVIVDNMSVFREHYEGLEGCLVQLSREGRSVGLSFIATGTQSNSLGYKLTPNFGYKICFTCNETGEYTNVFGRCRIEPKELPGRGLIMLDKRILEFQAALPVKGEKEVERVQGMHELINEQNTKSAGKAPEIPLVPETIEHSKLLISDRKLYKTPYNIPIGMDYASVGYQYLDLLSVGLFTIMSRKPYEKLNFVYQILGAVKEFPAIHYCAVTILDNTKKQLARFKEMDFISHYEADIESSNDVLNQILRELLVRQTLISSSENPEEKLAALPLILIIVNNEELLAEISDKRELFGTIREISKLTRSTKACMLFSCVENTPVTYGAPDIIKALKDNKNGIIFDEINNVLFFETGYKEQNEFKSGLTANDGFLISGSNIKRVKAILAD